MKFYDILTGYSLRGDMIPQEVILSWIKNKKRIQDRLNRIKKRLAKFEKQKGHFEMRIREISKYEKESSAKKTNP